MHEVRRTNYHTDEEKSRSVLSISFENNISKFQNIFTIFTKMRANVTAWGRVRLRKFQEKIHILPKRVTFIFFPVTSFLKNV